MRQREAHSTRAHLLVVAREERLVGVGRRARERADRLALLAQRGEERAVALLARAVDLRAQLRLTAGGLLLRSAARSAR